MPYLEALFGGRTFPDGTFIVDYLEDVREYQKAFMKVVSQIRNENMMTFPVLTYCLLRKDGKFVDEEFAKWCCEHNMKWADSNFFVSDDINSLSNCCFDGSQTTLTKDRDNIRYAAFRELWKLSEETGNYEYLVPQFNGWKKGRLIRLAPRKRYQVLTNFDQSLIVTDNHINITNRGEVVTSDLKVGDGLLCWWPGHNEPDEVYAEITSITELPTSSYSYVYCFEMLEGEPCFTLANGIVTHNCRLKSNIKDLGFFNSIGGTALEVGSVKVNTVNLARIAYETDREHYLQALHDRVMLGCKVLDVIRHIIQRNAEKGLLPNYTLGIINMKSQYMTTGISALYEAVQKYGYTYKDEFGYVHYTDEGIAFAQDLLKEIHKTHDEFKQKYNIDYMLNIEQIPGERAASVLMEKDRIFFPDEAYELPLYGNQWIPLGVKTSLEEKVRISALLDDACSGG